MSPRKPGKQENQSVKKFDNGEGRCSRGSTVSFNSDPTNLDKQNRDQACQDSHRAMPTLPIPSVPKPQKQQKKQENHQPRKDFEGPPRKDFEGISKPKNGETNYTMQANRGVAMVVPFQKSDIHFPFNSPNPPMPSQNIVASSLQMETPFFVGNIARVPHQMFASNILYHPLQPLLIMHQRQDLGFTPQFGYQVPPQLGSMEFVIAHQFPQSQPTHFSTQKRVVKITHPDTHEEIKLDKMTVSSGRRHIQNSFYQSQPFLDFYSGHQINYYKAPYNSSLMVFPPPLYLTNAEMLIGSQSPRYGCQVNQNGQAISFMNPSYLNQDISFMNQSSLNQAISTSSLVPVQMTIKPTKAPTLENFGTSSVRVSLPATISERPKLSTLSKNVASVPQQKCSKNDIENSLAFQKSNSELSEIFPPFAIDEASPTVFSTVSTQMNETEASPSLHYTIVEDSLSDLVEDDRRKNEAKQILESMVDHQRMSDKRKPRVPQQKQVIIGANNDDDKAKSVSNNCENIPSVTIVDSPTSNTMLLSVDVECRNSESEEMPSFVLDGRMTAEFRKVQGYELSDDFLLGSDSTRESGASNTGSLKEMPEAVSHGVKQQPPEKIISANFDGSKGINTEVEWTRILSNKNLKEIDINEFIALPPDVSSMPPVLSEIDQNAKVEAVDKSLGVPRMISKSREKPKATKTKRNRKKKIKEILSKADVAGTSDLYDENKTQDEEHDATINISEADRRCLIAELKNDAFQDCGKVSSVIEENGRDKVEFSKWEQPFNFVHHGTTVISSPSSHGPQAQDRGFINLEVRHEYRHPCKSSRMSVPLPMRSTDSGSISLRPQGGLAKEMCKRGSGLRLDVPSVEKSSRVGYPHRVVSGSNVFTPANQMNSTSRESLSGTSNHQISFQVHNSHLGVRDSLATRERPASSGSKSRDDFEAKAFSEDTLRQNAKDEKEVFSCIKELNAPYFYPSMLSLWITDSFERKDFERNLLSDLLVSLSKAQNILITQSQLIAGFESALSSLEDSMNDAPKAAEFLGHIFGKVRVENVLPLKEIGRMLLEGGEEPGSLTEFGVASEVLFGILEYIKIKKDDSFLIQIRNGSNIRFEDFRPAKSTSKFNRLDAFL